MPRNAVFESSIYGCISFHFRELVAYDQYAVIDACADACLDQLHDFVEGKTNYLPSVENVDFFMGITEIAKNLGGLIEFIEAVSSCDMSVENRLITIAISLTD